MVLTKITPGNIPKTPVFAMNCASNYNSIGVLEASSDSSTVFCRDKYGGRIVVTHFIPLEKLLSLHTTPNQWMDSDFIFHHNLNIPDMEFELHPIKKDENGIEHNLQGCDESEATHYSLFVHFEDIGNVCVADCRTKELGEQLMGMLEQQ